MIRLTYCPRAVKATSGAPNPSLTPQVHSRQKASAVGIVPLGYFYLGICLCAGPGKEWGSGRGGGGVAPCVGQISNLILADGKSPKVPLPRSHSGNVARVLRALGCRGNEMPSGAKLNLPHSSFYPPHPTPPPPSPPPHFSLSPSPSRRPHARNASSRLDFSQPFFVSISRVQTRPPSEL